MSKPGYSKAFGLSFLNYCRMGYELPSKVTILLYNLYAPTFSRFYHSLISFQGCFSKNGSKALRLLQIIEICKVIIMPFSIRWGLHLLCYVNFVVQKIKLSLVIATLLKRKKIHPHYYLSQLPG